MSNSFYRGLPVIKKRSLRDFGLESENTPSNWTELSKYSNYVKWKRYFKSTIVRLLTKS